MAPTRVKLEICGSTYTISTNEPEDYLRGLAERLDQDMNQIMVETPNASVTAAAVLTALRYLDEAEKSAFGADNLREQLQEYLEDASRARLAEDEARGEVDRLRRELEYYRDQNKKAAGRPTAAPQRPAPTANKQAPQERAPQAPAPNSQIELDK